MEYITDIKSLRNTAIKATVCIPDGNKTFPLLLMAHGFCSNRDEDGAFSILARRLMDNGVASIRIDFAGCNESNESYLLNTIDNDVNDLRSAYEFMISKYQITDTAVIGYSMGGKVAVHYIEKYKDIKTLVLFAPAVTNGLDWHNSSLELGRIDEMNRAYKLSIDSGYYNYHNTFDDTYIPLSKEFIEQCLNYKTYDIFNELKIPALMIYGDNDDIIPLSVYKEIIDNSKNMLFEHHLIKNANHGFGMWDNRKEQFEELEDTAFKYLMSKLKGAVQALISTFSISGRCI